MLTQQGSGVPVVGHPGHRGGVAATRDGAYENVAGGHGLRGVRMDVGSRAGRRAAGRDVTGGEDRLLQGGGA